MADDIKTKKRVRTLTALILLAVSLLLAGALYLLFIPIDLSRYHARIEAMVEARIGQKITIDSIVFKALPSTQISLKGVKLYDRGEAFVDARSVVIYSTPAGLLRRTPVLESLNLDGADIMVRRDPSGRINVMDFILTQTAVLRGLNIKNGSVRLVDEFAGRKSEFEMTGLDVYFYEFRNAFVYRLTGTLKPGSKVALSGKGGLGPFSVSGTGSLHDIDLARFNRYLFKGPEGISVKGTADIDASYAYAGNGSAKSVVRYRGLEAVYPSLFPGPIASPAGSASIEILTHDGAIDLLVKDARVEMKDFTINGSLKLSGPLSKPGLRTLALDLSTSTVPLKTIFGLIPTKSLPAGAASMIENFTPMGGGLRVQGLSLKMPVDDLVKLDILKKPDSIASDLLLDGVGFRYSGIEGAFSGISGLVSLKEGSIYLSGLTGRYGNEVIESLKGRIGDLGKRLVYDLSVKGRADVGETLAIARKFAGDGADGVGKKLSKVRAGGAADFTVGLKGALRGKKETAYSGSVGFRDCSLSYEGLPVGFASITGGMDFDNRTITLKGLGAKSGMSSISINGRIEGYGQANPAFNLRASGGLYRETLTPFIKTGPLAPLHFDGPVSFTIEAVGSPEAFTAKASADAIGSSIEYKNIIKKAPGYPLAVSGSGEFAGGAVDLKIAHIDFGRSSVEATGRASVDRTEYDIHAKAKGLMLSEIDDVSPFLAGDFESKGSASFDVHVSKKPGQASAEYRGSFSVTDSSFRTTFLPKPIERVNIVAGFDGNRASARIDGVSTGRTSLSGWVDVTDIAGRVINFSLYSPALFTEDIFPLTGDVFKKTEVEKGAVTARASKPPITGTGRIIVRGGEAWGQSFSGLRASVYMGADSVRIAPLEFTLDKGRVLGGVRIIRDKTDPALMAADFKLSELDVKSLIAGAGAKGDVLTGRLGGAISLTAARGRTPFTAGLNGKASLKSENGRLWQFPILSRIFSIVNIVSINELLTEGLPYRTIYGDFYVKDGVIHTDNLLLDSNVMRMSAVGEINMPNGTIDSILAVHPFVTIDKIISSIPLAGWIITGEKKSTVSMYFGVEGPLKDPDIYPKPIKTIEKDIFGIIRRVLEAPVEMLIPDKKKEGKE